MKKSETTGIASHTVDQAASQVHATIDQASAVAAPALEKLVSSAHQATNKLAVAADVAAGQLELKTRQLRDAQSRAANSCRTQIQEKPFTMLGIAVATGFLLSWLLRQRSRSQ